MIKSILVTAALITVVALAISACNNHGGSCCSCCTPRSVTHDQVINGKADLHDAQFNSLMVNGSADFKNVIIQKDLVVNGKAKITNSKINDTTVNGRTEIKNSKLTGTTTVTGSIELKDSIVEQVVLYTSDTQVLTNSNITSLIVQPGRPSQEVTIELVNTTITGDVTFKNADHATLVLKGTAQVKGQIIGATVKHN